MEGNHHSPHGGGENVEKKIISTAAFRGRMVAGEDLKTTLMCKVAGFVEKPTLPE